MVKYTEGQVLVPASSLQTANTQVLVILRWQKLRCKDTTQTCKRVYQNSCEGHSIRVLHRCSVSDILKAAPWKFFLSLQIHSNSLVEVQTSTVSISLLLPSWLLVTYQKPLKLIEGLKNYKLKIKSRNQTTQINCCSLIMVPKKLL